MDAGLAMGTAAWLQLVTFAKWISTPDEDSSRSRAVDGSGSRPQNLVG
jgi:hypothetical protein